MASTDRNPADSGSATDASRAPRISTRDQILRASLDLFNSEGFDGTSIAMICARVDIMAGNLTYYFPKKRDIVLAMKDEFEAALDGLQKQVLARMLADTGQASPGDTQRFLRAMLTIIWDYRFFFTSMMALHRLDRKIVQAFRQIEQQFRVGLSQLTQKGINDQAIHALRYPNSASTLADNIWYITWGCMFFNKARDKELEPEKSVVINNCLLQLGALMEPIVPSEFIAEYCRAVTRDG
jgi:AcrR family transcriptional regulator